MTRSVDTDRDRENDVNKGQVVYLIRRPGYELTFTVPTSHTAYLSGAQALLQLRFRKSPRGQEVVLTLQILEDLHESLSRLLEYVSIERRQGPGQPPQSPHSGSDLR